MLRVWASMLCLLISISSAAAMTLEERDQRFRSLKWITSAGTYSLPSGGEMSLPPASAMLIGNDAREFYRLNNAEYDGSIEAVLVDSNDNTLYIDYVASGYVSSDDWTDLDPDA